jgi:hypothetical protein
MTRLDQARQVIPRHAHRRSDTFRHVHNRPCMSTNRLETIRTRPIYNILYQAMKRHRPNTDQTRSCTTRHEQARLDIPRNAHRRSDTFRHVHNRPCISTNRLETIRTRPIYNILYQAMKTHLQVKTRLGTTAHDQT